MHHDSTRVMLAVRVNTMDLMLDGVLDDAIWQAAPKTTGFRQRQPDQGDNVFLVKVNYWLGL